MHVSVDFNLNTFLCHSAAKCDGRLDCNYGVIYLDFKKAFDRVPHNNLIPKLNCYGLGGKLVDWICHFLANKNGE